MDHLDIHRRDGHAEGSATSGTLDPLRYLARAGEILAASLDLDQTLEQLLDFVVPALADRCAIHLLDDDGRFRRVAARYIDPDYLELSSRLGDYYLDDGAQSGPVHDALERGQSLIHSP